MVTEVKALVKRILSVEFVTTEAKVTIAVICVAAVLCFAFYCAAGAGAMTKAPGCGGTMILRAAFEDNPGLYFSILRAARPAAAISFLFACCVSSSYYFFFHVCSCTGSSSHFCNASISSCSSLSDVMHHNETCATACLFFRAGAGELRSPIE
jgi:hypothetical protein